MKKNLCYYRIFSLKKQPTFRDVTTIVSPRHLGSACDWWKQIFGVHFSRHTTNQKHDVDPGSDTSSVWSLLSLISTDAFWLLTLTYVNFNHVNKIEARC